MPVLTLKMLKKNFKKFEEKLLPSLRKNYEEKLLKKLRKNYFKCFFNSGFTLLKKIACHMLIKVNFCRLVLVFCRIIFNSLDPYSEYGSINLLNRY